MHCEYTLTHKFVLQAIRKCMFICLFYVVLDVYLLPSQEMLRPLQDIKSLVTLDIHGIGCVDVDSMWVRFCGGHDLYEDGDDPVLLDLHRIGSTVLPNLVALDVHNCRGARQHFLKTIVANAPGRMWTKRALTPSFSFTHTHHHPYTIDLPRLSRATRLLRSHPLTLSHVSALEWLCMDSLGKGSWDDSYLDASAFMYSLFKMLRTTQVARTRYFSFGEQIKDSDYNSRDEKDPHALKNIFAASVVNDSEGNEMIEQFSIAAFLKSQQKPTNSIFYIDGYDLKRMMFARS